MEQEAMRERAAAVLSARNSHDVDRVLACYTEDCIYRDPNTRGAVEGHEALRRYLTRLFQDWRMVYRMQTASTLSPSGRGRGRQPRDRPCGSDRLQPDRGRGTPRALRYPPNPWRGRATGPAHPEDRSSHPSRVIVGAEHMAERCERGPVESHARVDIFYGSSPESVPG